ncbi:MAG TPA: cell wall hydrolase [Halanaerobiales bacterium]|nr:cell wall hydrolase [Halanaerobiales bacterium]
MNKATIKYTSLFTILILIMYLTIPVIFTLNIQKKVVAANIDNEDIYRGLAIALILILISRIGNTDSDAAVDIELPDIYDSELELLAKIINAEARGEPYEGQIAVGAVVLNRVKSPDFPDNVQDVIYQKGQFTSVDNGQINLSPGRTAYSAAREVLNGRDPSLGALFFYNPDKAITYWWLSQRETTVVIGDHVFAK